MTKKLSALAVIAMAALALPGFIAQRPATPEPIMPLPGRSQGDAPVSKSDEHRVVGTVLHIDAARGIVRLATDEGILVVQPQLQTVRAIRIGDTVSVPRSSVEQPSASPRK